MSYPNDDDSSSTTNEFNFTNLLSDFANETGNDNFNMTFTDIFTEELAFVVDVYCTPPLVILGTAGNLLSVLVFFKSKLRLQSTSQYLSALAISDTIFLLQLIPPWLKAVRWSRVLVREGFCQCFVYLTYVSSSSSAWLVVSFTVERFVAVLHPLRRTRMCTVRRARALILSVTVFCLAINTPVLKLAVPKDNDCNIDNELMVHAARFNVVDTIFSFQLPLTIITVLNICITIGVCKLSRARGHLIREDETQPRRRNSSRASQQRITKMLLIVSSVFVLLNLPAYSMRIVAYAKNMSSFEYRGKWAALQQICLLFFNINFGINFFLYCMTGQNFRRALCRTVGDGARAWRSLKQLCCFQNNQAPPPPRPRPCPSGSNSLSINTEASTNAGMSRVNYNQNIKSETAETTGSGSYLKLWPFKQSRYEAQQPEMHYELQVYPVQAFRFPGGQPERPVPRYPDTSSSLNPPTAAHNPAPPSVIAPQMFQPIPYSLVPGQIAPLDNVCPTPHSPDFKSPVPLSAETTLSASTQRRASTLLTASSYAPLSAPSTPSVCASPSVFAPPSDARPLSAYLPVASAEASDSESAPDSPSSADLSESFMWAADRCPSPLLRAQPARRFSLPARQWHGLERSDTVPGWIPPRCTSPPPRRAAPLLVRELAPGPRPPTLPDPAPSCS